jgi:DNA-binding NarL/FixJ family response regulator
LPDTAPITVLIVDDEAIVRAGLVMLISAEPRFRVVGEATDGAHAVDLAAELDPDVVLMDLRMSGMDGVQATRHLASDDLVPRTRRRPAILVLTTFSDDAAVYEALRAGASGFLLKNGAPRFLADAIGAVAAGDAWLDQVVTKMLLADFVGPGKLERLTLREQEVLKLVAHGLANAAIAAELVLSEATVKTHLRRLMFKLDLHHRAEAVAVAYKTGLVRPEDQPPAFR